VTVAVRRRWGLFAIGAVAVLVGLVLLVTPTGVHHSGNCGSVVAPRHPTLNHDDTLAEQVLADSDCPGERHFQSAPARSGPHSGRLLCQ
jgi:hypothetical protein